MTWSPYSVDAENGYDECAECGEFTDCGPDGLCESCACEIDGGYIDWCDYPEDYYLDDWCEYDPNP